MSTGGHLCPRQWRTAGTSTVSQAYSNSLNTKAINYHYQKYNYRYSFLIHHKLKINKVFFTADKFWIYKDMLRFSIFSLMMSSEVNCEYEDSLKKSLNLKSTECERAKLYWKIAFSIHSTSPEFCQFLFVQYTFTQPSYHELWHLQSLELAGFIKSLGYEVWCTNTDNMEHRVGMFLFSRLYTVWTVYRVIFTPCYFRSFTHANDFVLS